MMETGSAREVALQALVACRKQGAWSDGYLKKAIREAGLDSRDGALATRLCFGVLQNRMLLDFYLAQFSRLPLGRMEEQTLEALRLGAYQVLFLTKIPPSAAVNESVELARKYAHNPKAPGVVNGILRNLLRQKDQLRQPPDLATRYSHPDWLVKEFSLALKDDEALERLLEMDNSRPATYAQINTLHWTGEQAALRLTEEGVEVTPHPWLPNCLQLSGTGDIERLKSFQDGAFYVQDPAARMAVLAADPAPGMRVLDACAAPGGKSFAAAMIMGGSGELVACDIHPHKERLICAGAERLGITCIDAQTQDGRVFREEWTEKFDCVLADVPCSGLGIIRKKPDIRYKDPQELQRLPEVQRSILDNVARYVRRGGVLLYSTCTVLERENRAVVQRFLADHPEFTAERFQLPDPVGECREGMLTLWPHLYGTDGFFVAKLRRG